MQLFFVATLLVMAGGGILPSSIALTRAVYNDMGIGRLLAYAARMVRAGGTMQSSGRSREAEPCTA